jgi:hypothetical protein
MILMLSPYTTPSIDHTSPMSILILKNKTAHQGKTKRLIRLQGKILTTDITKQSKAAIIQVLRIEFLQQTKKQREYTVLANSSHNALSIVHAEPALPQGRYLS